MTSDAVRSLIREVLAEELSRMRKNGSLAKVQPTQSSKPAHERVTITSDEELQFFARKIAKLCANKQMRDKIMRGDHVFKLDNTRLENSSGQTGNIATTTTSISNGVVEITDGFLSERKVETLPEGTRLVRLGPAVRFTPLARDRLRQRKIAVERIR